MLSNRAYLLTGLLLGGVGISHAGDMTVTGVIQANSLKLKDWTLEVPDYVFEPGYRMEDLGQVREFVQKNKHLPEIPSAKEMKEKGMDLADMNLRLLKKVEELT